MVRVGSAEEKKKIMQNKVGRDGADGDVGGRK